MNISKETVDKLLTSFVKESTLSENAKNTLAVMINSLMISEGAQETGVLVASTHKLREWVGVGTQELMEAIRELKMYDLIERIPGKKRMKGEHSTASRYIINFEALQKPIIEPTTEQIYQKLMNKQITGNPYEFCNGNGKEKVNDKEKVKDKEKVNVKENEKNKENLNANDNSNYKMKGKENLNDKEKVNDNYVKVEQFINEKGGSGSVSIGDVCCWIENNFSKKEHEQLQEHAKNILLNAFKTTSSVQLKTEDVYVEDERVKYQSY